MVEDCIFCKIASGEVKKNLIYENDNFVAFLDDAPQIEGHTLIIPKKHSINTLDMPATLGTELLEAIKAVAEIKLKEGFEGYNLLQNNFHSAGQVVMHTHFHFLPRKAKDNYYIGVNRK